MKIKTTNGRIIETVADPDLTIYDLKAICCEELETEPENQTLLFKGKVCDNDDTLESIKITNNSTLIVLLRKHRRSQQQQQQQSQQQQLIKKEEEGVIIGAKDKLIIGGTDEQKEKRRKRKKKLKVDHSTFNLLLRYKDLAKWFNDHKLYREATWYKNRLKSLTAVKAVNSENAA